MKKDPKAAKELDSQLKEFMNEKPPSPSEFKAMQDGLFGNSSRAKSPTK